MKPLQKLIARVAKQYNIPPGVKKFPVNFMFQVYLFVFCKEITPNLTKNRSEGTLRYLLHRRYVEKAMESANFEDMVLQAVETCPHLASYLLTILCEIHNDPAEALKWSAKFDVPYAQWPYKLKKFVGDHSDESLKEILK